MEQVDKQWLTSLVEDGLSHFYLVAKMAGLDIASAEIMVEYLHKPHKAPVKLPTGKMAVYAFFADGVALKVGKVGPNSQARYTSQHYNAGSAMSTLAASISKRPAVLGLAIIDPATLAHVIRERTDRVNILVPISYGEAALNLLEAFLHCRWKPAFEGRSPKLA